MLTNIIVVLKPQEVDKSSAINVRSQLEIKKFALRITCVVQIITCNVGN